MDLNEPIPIWGENMPSIPIEPAIRESKRSQRKNLRIKAQEIPNIEPFLVSSSDPTPVILVTPGGAYSGRAPHEGKPICLWLNSLGISTFVLNYRVTPFRHPIPFLDAQRAIRHIRFNAVKYNIDPMRVGMLGFSAGGHLTSTIGSLIKRVWFLPNYTPDEIDQMPDLPNLLILCYPVISLLSMPEGGSYFNLLGKNPDPNLVVQLSTETQVTPTTPPSFIWTTRTDKVVPYLHSLAFAEALRRNGIECELHVFDHGAHGLGLAEKDSDIHQWTKYCSEWLHQQGF